MASTPGLEAFVCFASRLKNVLSLESSNLTVESDTSTSGFHWPKVLSNSAAADSMLEMRASRNCSTTENSAKQLAMAISWLVKPSLISSRIFVSSSINNLVFGSIAPNFFCRRVVRLILQDGRRIKVSDTKCYQLDLEREKQEEDRRRTEDWGGVRQRTERNRISEYEFVSHYNRDFSCHQPRLITCRCNAHSTSPVHTLTRPIPAQSFGRSAFTHA
jgi:hypothetical protein